MTRTRHVRLGLVAVAALLTLLVAIQPGHSQIRPPGARFPGIPTGPAIPPPGGPPGFGGPTIYEWRCGRCGRLLGTGTQVPASAYCSLCRVNNTFPGAGGGAGIIPPEIPAPPPPPVFTPPAPVFPPVQPEPPRPFENGVYVAPTPSTTTSTSDGRFSYGTRVLLITLGVLLLLGIGVTSVVIAIVKQQPAKRRSRPRRRRRLDDDY